MKTQKQNEANHLFIMVKELIYPNGVFKIQTYNVWYDSFKPSKLSTLDCI